MAADIAAALPAVADIFAPENQTTWIAVTAALIGVVVGFWLGKKASQP